MNIFRVFSTILCYLFLCLIHGNNLKVGSPILVHGWSFGCLTSCCRGSSTSDTDKSKSSDSSDGSEFELNIKKAEGRSPDGRAPEGRSAEGRSAEGRSPDGRAPDGRSAEGRSPDKRTPEGGSDPTKPSENQPAQAKPTQDQSAEGGSDPTKPSQDQPGDKSDKYELTTDGNCMTYKIKSGAKCKAIKVEDKEVWKYDSNESNGKYPTMIWCVNCEKLYVGFGQDHLEYEKGSDGNWKASKNPYA